MSIHVSPSLDQDQRICRPISFYDLVELTTYGKLSFNQSSKVRLASLRAPIKKEELTFENAAAQALREPAHTALQTTSTSTTVLYQSWALLEHEHAIDWGGDDASAPSIHIVSTINALAESLYVGDDMEAFIDRTSRLIGAPERLQSMDATAIPIFDDGTLTVTLLPRDRTEKNDRHLTLRLPIDLKTLLRSVLVSPKAPTRFVELVSDLVQRISNAHVSRANLLGDAAGMGAHPVSATPA